MTDETATSGKMKKRRAGPADVEIGRKIRALRLERGLSQTDLAGGIGLTFQQVQKYEKGVNRVSASRLQQACNVLQVPVQSHTRTPVWTPAEPPTFSRRAMERVSPH